MVVRISGGPSGRTKSPMMIFTNADGSNEIRGVKDDVPGVCYRTEKKGWMTKRVFREYLQEKRAMNRDRLGREKVVFLDNCSGHIAEDDCKEELSALNAKPRYLPPNATDLCQPADSFIIAKIEDFGRASGTRRRSTSSTATNGISTTEGRKLVWEAQEPIQKMFFSISCGRSCPRGQREAREERSQPRAEGDDPVRVVTRA